MYHYIYLKSIISTLFFIESMIKIIILIVIYSLYHFRDVISPAPTCFDGKANGLENGIDCGGNCNLMCTDEVKPLIVEWSSFIKTKIQIKILNLNTNYFLCLKPKKSSYLLSLPESSLPMLLPPN